MSDQLLNHRVIILQKPLCIGIGGVSRSGKTFLAKLLNEAISNSVVISQDTFIPIESEIPKINGHIDWERPEAIDWDKFKTAVESGVHARKTVIAEGLLAFNNPGINKLYNKAIYITLNKQEFFKRKRNDLRWGKEPEWYVNHIWEGYLCYGQLPKVLVNTMIINGEADFNTTEIMNYLKS